MCRGCNAKTWDAAGMTPMTFADQLPPDRRRRCEIAYRLLRGAVNAETGTVGGALHVQLDDDNYDFPYDPDLLDGKWHAGEFPLVERVAGAAWNGLTVLERALVCAWVWDYWIEVPRPTSPLATGIPLEAR